MTFHYEYKKIKEGYTHIIGCDEAGRGSLAGPVVAAAVVMEHKTWSMKHKIKDSKLLSPGKREELSEQIKQHAVWRVGVVSQNIIDQINIHNATLLAMRRAVEGLNSPLDFAWDNSDKTLVAVDGRFIIPNFSVPQEAIIDGDNKVLSIAAASIIAKVYRDELMRDHHQHYPIYNFAQHKGYGTLYHRKMIIEHGLSPLHRLTFCRSLTG